MKVQTLKLDGKRFVIMPEKTFRDLERRANGVTKKPRAGHASRTRGRMSAAMRERLEDEADVRAGRAALREKGAIPWEQVKAELGLSGLGNSTRKSSTTTRRSATA